MKNLNLFILFVTFIALTISCKKEESNTPASKQATTGVQTKSENADVQVSSNANIYTKEVKVVKEGCSVYGIWGDFWLSSSENNTVSYYLVQEIDKNINYAPIENDKLKISFKYAVLSDSLKVCPPYKQLRPTAINIVSLIK